MSYAYAVVSQAESGKPSVHRFNELSDAVLYYSAKKRNCDKVALMKGEECIDSTGEYIVLLYLKRMEDEKTCGDPIKSCQRKRMVKDCTHCIRWEKGECLIGMNRYKKENNNA